MLGTTFRAPCPATTQERSGVMRIGTDQARHQAYAGGARPRPLPVAGCQLTGVVSTIGIGMAMVSPFATDQSQRPREHTT